MCNSVVSALEPKTQLIQRDSYIAAATSPEIAPRFADSVVTYSESLRRRAILAFHVDEDRINVI